MTQLTARITIRKDTAANWTSANPVLSMGEIALETDTAKKKTGNGVTAWVGLAYDGGGVPIIGLGAVGFGDPITGELTSYAEFIYTATGGYINITRGDGAAYIGRMASGIYGIQAGGGATLGLYGGANTILMGSGGYTDFTASNYHRFFGMIDIYDNFGNQYNGTLRVHNITNVAGMNSYQLFIGRTNGYGIYLDNSGYHLYFNSQARFLTGVGTGSIDRALKLDPTGLRIGNNTSVSAANTVPFEVEANGSNDETLVKFGNNITFQTNLNGFSNRSTFTAGGIELANSAGIENIAAYQTGYLGVTASVQIYFSSQNTYFQDGNVGIGIYPALPSAKLDVQRTTIGGSGYFKNDAFNLAGVGPLVAHDGQHEISLGYSASQYYIRRHGNDMYFKGGSTSGYGFYFENMNLVVNGKVRVGDNLINSGYTFEVVGTIMNTNTIGTGSRMVEADASGVFSATIPVGECFIAPVSDETTVLTTGTGKLTFRIPYAFSLLGISASLKTAQTSGSIFTVDVNKNGTTVLSTKITIDNTEKTSSTAVTPPVISVAAFAAHDEITIDIDQVGDGTAIGCKVEFIIKRTA